MISPVASRSERARTTALRITLLRRRYGLSLKVAALLTSLIWREHN